MRYVVVDLAGNQRGSYESRDELLDVLYDGAIEQPEVLRSLYVLTYDAAGHEVGEAQRADKVLATRLVWSTQGIGATRSWGNVGSKSVAIRSAQIVVGGENGTNDRVADIDILPRAVEA